MAAPQIRYAKTSDDVSIAYFDVGSGTPLVFMPNMPFSHVELEWEDAPWYQRLSEICRLIRYDGRGNGLSERDTDDFSSEAFRRDLDAVVAAANLDRFALFSMLGATMTAVAYAADHPQAVTTLFLWEPYARPTDYFDQPAMPAFASALQHDFDLYSYMAAGHAFGWEEAEQMVRWGRDLLPQATTPDIVRRTMRALRRETAEDVLPRVHADTVILHRRQNPLMTLDGVRRVAAGIPNSRLVVLEGRSFYPFSGDGDAVLRVVEEQLTRPGAESPANVTGSFRTILFTDVVASTPLLAQLKDARMREVMRDHDAVLQAAVDEHGGRVIKTIGDAFMAEFAVPSAAVDCAIAMQRGIQAQFADSDVPIRLRIGINAGEPIAEDDDLHGISVNIAKRLESAAATNGILVSDVVKAAVAGKDFEFADQGEVSLKGLEEPVRAWSVGWAP